MPNSKQELKIELYRQLDEVNDEIASLSTQTDFTSHNSAVMTCKLQMRDNLQKLINICKARNRF